MNLIDKIPQKFKRRVSVVLVTYNGELVIRKCLESLAKQTYTDFTVLVIDNGSTDDTLSVISQDFPYIKLIQRRENLGFAKAYNHGLAWSKEADYILCLNQDAFLESDYLQSLVEVMDSDSQIGSSSGLLLRYDLLNDEPTQVIDSLGFGMRRTHRVFNIAEGKVNDRRSTELMEVFGVSATAVMYRRTALEEVALRRDGRVEYFDEDFFAYKEDVDLAWRLRLTGYKCYMVPKALGYHVRTIRKQKRWHRQDRRPLIKQLSYRNHLLTIFANEPLINLFLLAPWIITFELGKLLYALLLEPSTVSWGWKGFFKLLGRSWKKRRFVQGLRKIKCRELRAWFH